MSSLLTPRRAAPRTRRVAEVVADRPDDPDIGEEARREGEMHGGSAEHPLALAERRPHGIEGDGADDGQRHGAPVIGRDRTRIGGAAARPGPLPARLARVKAVQITEFGGPEVLSPDRVPDPVPGDGETLVARHPRGRQLRRHPRDPQRLPRQAAAPGHPRRRDDAGPTPDGHRVAAMLMNGGYAEKVAVPDAALVPVPDEVDDDQAAALLLQGITAYSLLRISRPSRDGESVVVARGRRRHGQPRGPARQAPRRRPRHRRSPRARRSAS